MQDEQAPLAHESATEGSESGDVSDPSSNGHGPAERRWHEAEDFPLETLRDAAADLRRPFTAEAVRFKLQTSWPDGNPTDALIVAYIDARLVYERLNLVVPHLWADEFAELDDKRVRCDLTVDGRTRSDIGFGGWKSQTEGKGAYSDAIKRAAVHFGIGVSLYAIPKMFLKVEGGALKAKRKGQKHVVEVTAKGDKQLRTMYGAWLDALGISTFGPPLDHGDVPGAQGDPDDPNATVPTEAGQTALPTDDTKTITKARAQKIADRVWKVEVQDKLQLAITHVSDTDVGPIETKAYAVTALREALTEPQAVKIDEWLDRKEREAVKADA